MTRPMTQGLQSALDALDASQRRVFVNMARQASDTWFGSLIRGLAFECYAMEVVEIETLNALAQDHLAEMNEFDARHPYPVLPPKHVDFDPDSDPTP